jgi:hypothetical protein
MSQGLLFTESSIAETGVWCTLNEEVDPAQWAGVCRQIGQFSQLKFQLLRQLLRASGQSEEIPMPNPHRKPYVHIPLVSLGPSGIGGEYQREVG